MKGLDSSNETERQKAASGIVDMAESIVGNISKFAWDVTVLRVGQLASEICFSSHNQSIGGSNGCAGELTNWDGTKKRRRGM